VRSGAGPAGCKRAFRVSDGRPQGGDGLPAPCAARQRARTPGAASFRQASRSEAAHPCPTVTTALSPGTVSPAERRDRPGTGIREQQAAVAQPLQPVVRG